MGDRRDPKDNQAPSGGLGNPEGGTEGGVNGAASAVARDAAPATPHIVHMDGRPAVYGNQSGTYRVDPERRRRDEERSGESLALEQAIESELKTWTEPGGLRDEDIEVEDPPSVIVDWRAATATDAREVLKPRGDAADDGSDWREDATTARGWRSERRSTSAPKARGREAGYRMAAGAIVVMLLAGTAGFWWLSTSGRGASATRQDADPASVGRGRPGPSQAIGTAEARASAPLAASASSPSAGVSREQHDESASASARDEDEEEASSARSGSSAPAQPSRDAVGRDEPRSRSGRRAERRARRQRTRGVEAPVRTAAAATAEAQPQPAAGSEAQAEPTLPETLSRSRVRAGMEKLRPRMEACAAGRHGVAEARVVIAASGDLMHAVIGDDFQGTEEGSCMARALRGARFPAFENGPMNVRYPFSL